jgi:hypothetical protein
VFLLCFAVCFWLLAFASHVHALDEGKHGQARTACTVCHSLPSGAPAPAILQVAVSPVLASDIAAPIHARSPAEEAPGAYLIRGPPQA